MLDRKTFWLCVWLLAGCAILGALSSCGAGPTDPSMGSTGQESQIIVVFGDSILADAHMAELLRQRLPAGYQVVDATKPGEKTDAGRVRLAEVLRTVESGGPLAVLVLEGTNDYRQADLGIDTADNLAAMAAMIRAAGGRALIGTIPPVGPAETRPARAAWVRETNERLRAANVATVEVYGALADPARYGPNLFVDHLHLSAAGTAILVDVFYAALMKG